LADVKALAAAIGASASITTVALSDHYIGPDILVALSPAVVESERIRTLRVDGNDLYSLEVWRRVLLQWQARRAPLDIAWPEFEMALLLKGNPEVRPKVSDVRELWQAVVTGTGTGQKAETTDDGELDRSGSMDLSVFRETPSIGNVFAFGTPELTADDLAIPAWIAGRA
jgi:hypothetical protein